MERKGWEIRREKEMRDGKWEEGWVGKDGKSGNWKIGKEGDEGGRIQWRR